MALCMAAAGAPGVCAAGCMRGFLADGQRSHGAGAPNADVQLENRLTFGGLRGYRAGSTWFSFGAHSAALIVLFYGKSICLLSC